MLMKSSFAKRSKKKIQKTEEEKKKGKTCCVTFVDFGCSPQPISPPAGMTPSCYTCIKNIRYQVNETEGHGCPLVPAEHRALQETWQQACSPAPLLLPHTFCSLQTGAETATFELSIC